jgi:hypothetical protein
MLNRTAIFQGAIERSLETWEKQPNIKFQVSWTDKQALSPTGKIRRWHQFGNNRSDTGKSFVVRKRRGCCFRAPREFFSIAEVNITEADIVLNPYEQFSTDGSFGTFDFEATLTHEIGHLLGLDHSSINGATMHEHQGKNGVYNLAAFSSRTLAEDDLAGIRALYGAKPTEEHCCGTIAGRLIQANGKAVKDFQVWAEEAESGRVAAGVLSGADGNFRIEGLLAGQYKIYAQDFGKNSGRTFSVEELGEVGVVKGKTQILAKKLKSEIKNFDVRYVGFNGQVSELAVPVNSGKSYLIYVGGKNLDANKVSIGFNSSYISVTPKSLTNHKYGEDVSVISFEINVAGGTPLGEYSFFVKSKDESSEFAVGSLTVETFTNSWSSYLLSAND